MTDSLDTYTVAELIHDSVWQRNNLLSDKALASSRLIARLGHMSNVEQVVYSGSRDPSEPLYETLSKGSNGLYYFQATAGFGYVGELTLGRHIITPRDNEKIANRFARSLIVREFVRVTQNL